MWKNVVQPDWPQTAKYSASALHSGQLRLHALRICNTYCIFTAMMVTRMRLSVPFIRTLPISNTLTNNTGVTLQVAMPNN